MAASAGKARVPEHPAGAGRRGRRVDPHHRARPGRALEANGERRQHPVAEGRRERRAVALGVGLGEGVARRVGDVEGEGAAVVEQRHLVGGDHRFAAVAERVGVEDREVGDVAEVLDLTERLARPVEWFADEQIHGVGRRPRGGPASAPPPRRRPTRQAHTIPACSATRYDATFAVAGMRSWSSWGIAVQRPSRSYSHPWYGQRTQPVGRRSPIDSRTPRWAHRSSSSSSSPVDRAPEHQLLVEQGDRHQPAGHDVDRSGRSRARSGGSPAGRPGRRSRNPRPAPYGARVSAR